MTPLSSLLSDYNTDLSRLNVSPMNRTVQSNPNSSFEYPYHLMNGSMKKRKSKIYDDMKQVVNFYFQLLTEQKR